MFSLEESIQTAKAKHKKYLVTGTYGDDDVYDTKTAKKIGKVKDLLESFDKNPE